MKRPLVWATLALLLALAANASAQEPRTERSAQPGLERPRPRGQHQRETWGLDATATSRRGGSQTATTSPPCTRRPAARWLCGPQSPAARQGLVANTTTASFPVTQGRGRRSCSRARTARSDLAGRRDGGAAVADRSASAQSTRGSRSRRRGPPVRNGLPQRPRRRLRRHAPPVSPPGAFTDPASRAGMPRSGSRTSAARSSSPSPSRTRTRKTKSQGQGRVRRRVRPRGKLLARIGQHGQLNAPWGIAQAPSGFGRFSGDLLIGNFGDGEISAFGRNPRRRLRPARPARARTDGWSSIDGLWALEFGHGAANNGPANTLFFTAGPDDEEHGLFGTITAS